MRRAPAKHGSRPAWRRWVKWLALGLFSLALLAPLLFAGVARLGSVPEELFHTEGVLSLTVLDRQGEVLRQTAARTGGRERWVPLADISSHIQQATLAAEDHRFYQHHGVDWPAVARAVWLNLELRRLAFGGSTITMQLARTLQPHARDLVGKLGEAIVALRIERRLSKPQILEQYLNRVYYGAGAWGVEAAAQRYFGKTAANVSVGEAALLAVLPRNPSRYHPYRHLDRALARRAHVLDLMQRRGYIEAEQQRLARRTPMALTRRRPRFRAPHFVDHVVSRLPPAHRQGAVVRTTLDAPLQRLIEVSLRNHLGRVGWLNVTQAAVVVLRNRDGAVLAMVGSRDYFDAEHNGAFNGATARLRPGSTLKPFVYALALERGDTPASVAYDVVLPDEIGEDYTKDVRQHGMARYRESLAGSYNLAAVHTLRRVGVHSALHRLRLAGLTTLQWPDHRYDLGLAIGYAEVRLLELAAAFSAFGRSGRALKPYAIVDSQLADGGVWRSERSAGPRVFSPRVAYQIYDILQDPDARRPMFGQHVPLSLPFRVALKTGTTRAYTDNWALGTTREYTVGVWAGNFDGSPTHGVMSMRGATPLLRAAYTAIASRFGEPTAPPRPEGLVSAAVCAASGMHPGPHCPHRKLELFAKEAQPKQTCTWHRELCGKRVTLYPQKLHGWLRARGKLPPMPACPQVATAEPLRIVYPSDGARFVLDPHRPVAHQLPPFRAAPAQAKPRWTIDGTPLARWQPTPGEHLVRASLGSEQQQVRVSFE